jgi:hypothetical protein
MDVINTIILWFGSNWVNITNIIAYTIAIASIIVRFTPTPKDDDFLKKIIDFLSKYIALNK